MNQSLPRRLRPRLLCLGVVAALTLPVMGQPPGGDRSKSDVIEPPVLKIVKNAAGPRADGAKTEFVEPPTKAVVRGSAPDGDLRKGKIEFPAKGIAARSAAPGEPGPARRTGDDAANPTVKAGEVKWHASFAAACEAAKKSGKPVLLFHMMGQLDKQFC